MVGTLVLADHSILGEELRVVEFHLEEEGHREEEEDLLEMAARMLEEDHRLVMGDQALVELQKAMVQPMMVLLANDGHQAEVDHQDRVVLEDADYPKAADHYPDSAEVGHSTLDHPIVLGAHLPLRLQEVDRLVEHWEGQTMVQGELLMKQEVLVGPVEEHSLATAAPPAESAVLADCLYQAAGEAQVDQVARAWHLPEVGIRDQTAEARESWQN